MNSYPSGGRWNILTNFTQVIFVACLGMKLNWLRYCIVRLNRGYRRGIIHQPLIAIFCLCYLHFCLCYLCFRLCIFVFLYMYFCKYLCFCLGILVFSFCDCFNFFKMYDMTAKNIICLAFMSRCLLHESLIK